MGLVIILLAIALAGSVLWGRQNRVEYKRLEQRVENLESMITTKLLEE
jgi:hypothetical protein